MESRAISLRRWSASIAIASFAALLYGAESMPLAFARADTQTIAGTGYPGFEDGPAHGASFMMPAGVATDAAGNVYIADAAAQRVRRLTVGGTVETVAGSGPAIDHGLLVAGGYKDGPASSAQFDYPMGVAVTRDASQILVADMYNHCIRYVKNGIVGTMAGSPDRIGNRDGTVADASFTYPRDIAVADDGTAYVVDSTVGIRKIANGFVTTLALPAKISKLAYGIALWQQNGRTWLFVSNADGIVELTGDGKLLRYFRTQPTDPLDAVDHALLEGENTIGYPRSLLALGPDTVAYTDSRMHAVRYLRDQFGTWIASHPWDDADTRGGGYLDGPNESARFFSPWGIAALPGGRAAVADAGNRVIRAIPLPDDRSPLTANSGVEVYGGNRDEYRIAYIGGSSVYYNTLWGDSVPGRIENALNNDRGSNGLKRRVHVYALRFIGGDVAGYETYIRNVLAGLVDEVILEVNAPTVNAGLEQWGWSPLAPVAATWQPRLTQDLGAAGKSLRGTGTDFLVVLTPVSWQVSPLEQTFFRSESPNSAAMRMSDHLDEESLMSAAIRASGADMLDAFPDFIDAERTPWHPPLWGTRDFHLTSAGNALLAGLIVRKLEADRPWLERLPAAAGTF